MSCTLFIADLHLHPKRPHTTDLFHRFLQHWQGGCDGLYILGDLFEFWLGDDQHDNPYQLTLSKLKSFSQDGELYFMRGNRDFLVGTQFGQSINCTLLDDPCLIKLYGQQTLLLHGDTLCTDDADYMRFRQTVRTQAWIDHVLGMPLAKRKHYFEQLRTQSQDTLAKKDPMITDVNQQAVEKVTQESGATLIIHGHTHRPAIHQFQCQQLNRKRIVLGDWNEQGSVLICKENGSQELQTV